jgi:polar amino acid transport system substrate-binding protein
MCHHLSRMASMKNVTALLFLGILVATPVMGQSTPWPLAPSGTLRTVFLRTNPVHGRVDPRTGEVTGPVADVARELARRHEVTARIIPAENAAAVIAALKAGEADIGVLAYDETRAREVDFGAPIMVMLNSYLVKASSSIKSSADVDRTGVTVAAVKGQTQELFVSRHLKQARVRLFDTMPPDAEVARLLVSGEVDAFAINRQRSLEAEASSGSTVRTLPDSFLDVNQCVVVAKGARAKLDEVARSVAELRAAGFLQSAVDRAKLAGVKAAARAQCN